MTRIVVRKDGENWRLSTEPPGTATALPAGNRLRMGATAGNAWPIRSFIFNTEQEAKEAAAALEKYIANEQRRMSRSSHKRGRR